ncbi:hypothetical protein [uncultured Eubacterium sp.]|uniref:hypothetical protein n=1 Tax=uncultured Eubacterium sp. TaxID=165185 RepID=UPI00326746C2
MAKATLPVNFKDDILNAGMDGKRKFTITQNTDGTYSIEDVTEYDQIGSNFGSAQINATNTAVNASADASKIIDDLATVAANTQKGYMAGALALKEVNQSLSSIVFRSIVAKTSSGGDSFLLELDDAITSSSPLLIQFQSNSSNAQVEKYFITKPGKVRVILTESVVPGTWKFNVAYKK